MELWKNWKRHLFFCFFLSVLLVLIGTFDIVIVVIEFLLFVFFMMCVFAHQHGAGTKNRLPQHLVKVAAQSGSTAEQVYVRGMVASSTLFLIIPALYNWVKNSM